MSERMLFVTRLKSGERMTDLCGEFGISRKTGYKLLDRFDRLGPAGLFDVPRRPKRLANAKPPELRVHVLETKQAHPTWGAKKLRKVLSESMPGVPLPAVSTICDWLDKAGLVTRRKRKRGISPYLDTLRESLQPNDILCVDYKGQFRLGNGKYCYPLTVTDHFSRYLLACEGFERIDGDSARAVFEELFAKHGLPAVIRSDNGSPFAARSLFGLTRLSAWWMKLGIIPERIEPAHPQQNGRHERMHRTLKEETTRPAKANLLQQQERFDAFVHEYNVERPHEALGLKRPAEIYKPSPRPFEGTRDLEYPFHDDVIRVAPSGHARILRRRGAQFYLSAALADERVGIRELPSGKFLLTFARLDIGTVDTATNRFEAADYETAKRPASSRAA